MRRTVPRTILHSLGLFLLVPLAAVACRTPARIPDGEVVTLLDYFETGRRNCDRYLAREESSALREAVEHARAACVRVRARRPPPAGAPGPWETFEGSGAFISGGTLVLTAGHGIPEGSSPALDVRTTDGATHAAVLVDRVYAEGGESSPDWALVRLRRRTPPRGVASLAPGVAREGTIVAALGYPGGIGLDAKGRVVAASADEKAPLAPMVIVARIVRVDPLELEPVAGAFPVTGMSGGPVVDENGRVLGVTKAVNASRGTLLATRLAPVVQSRPEEVGKEMTP